MMCESLVTVEVGNNVFAGVHSSSGEHAMPSFHCRRRRFRMELSRIAGEKRLSYTDSEDLIVCVWIESEIVETDLGLDRWNTHPLDMD